MNTDLEEALIAWQGGELPEDRAEALLTRLREDAGFRATLAELIWTLSLSKVAQSPDPRWITLQEELGMHEADGAGENRRLEDSLMAAVRREPRRFVSSGWRIATALAAAAAILFAGLLWLQTEPALSSQEVIAVWVPKDAQQPSRTVTAGPLHLAQGQAKLLFTQGVVVDVEGPAELEIHSESRMVCRQGKLRTQVPPGAEGFCVETPQGAVTDLGTVLGITVSAQGRTDVNVFEGQAELSASIPGQAGLRTLVLNEAEKASLGAPSGLFGMSEATDFLASIQPLLPRLRLPVDQRERMLAAKPVHYWRMNRLVEGKVPNEVTGGPSLSLAGKVEIGASARFWGKEAPGVIHSEQPWIAPGSGYALELWFMAETLDQTALLALTTPDPKRPHLGLIELGCRPPGQAAGAGVLRYLLRWPAGHRDGMNLFSAAASALPYQWHHVVAQQARGRMELFLDGKPLGPAQSDAVPADHPAMFQIGALEWRPEQDLTQLRRAFCGQIAELAVYDRTLTAREIAEHARPLMRSPF